MQPTVVLVGSGAVTLRLARARGFRCVLIQSSERFDPAQGALADELVIRRLEDAGAVAEVVEAVHRRTPVHAVLSFTEMGLWSAAVAAARVGAIGQAPDAVRLTRDKLAMRECLARRGLSPVRYARCGNLDEAVGFQAELGGPVIVKNPEGWGKIGVSFAATPEDLPAAFAAAAPDGVPVLLEECLDGPQVSVETLTAHGTHHVIAITDTSSGGPPHFLELGHSQPTVLPVQDQRRIADLVTRCLEAFGMNLGPSHTEVGVTRDGPRIVESHTRPGGDLIEDLVEHVYGVNLIGSTMDVVLGRRFEWSPPVPPRGGAAVRFLTLPAGVVRRISGVEAARAVPGVIDVAVDLAPGMAFGGTVSNFTRGGHALATGATAAVAVATAEQAAAAIAVDMSPLAAARAGGAL